MRYLARNLFCCIILAGAPLLKATEPELLGILNKNGSDWTLTLEPADPKDTYPGELMEVFIETGQGDHEYTSFCALPMGDKGQTTGIPKGQMTRLKAFPSFKMTSNPPFNRFITLTRNDTQAKVRFRLFRAGGTILDEAASRQG